MADAPFALCACSRHPPSAHHHGDGVGWGRTSGRVNTRKGVLGEVAARPHGLGVRRWTLGAVHILATFGPTAA